MPKEPKDTPFAGNLVTGKSGDNSTGKVEVVQDEEDDDDSDEFEMYQSNPKAHDGTLGRNSTEVDGSKVGEKAMRRHPTLALHLNSTVQGMTSSKYGLYTPVQKWEYENGLPVDGVKNVKQWALDVGLADDGTDESPLSKKKRKVTLTEPPKYAGTTTRIMISSAEEEDTSPKDKPEGEEEAHKNTICKGKGKEKYAKD